MNHAREPAVWFPTIRTGTGTDIFTERLVAGLREHGLRAAITWLPLRAEYAPWTVPIPKPPRWANLVQVNTWLHPRFLPKHLSIVATLHHAVHQPNVRAYKGFARTAYHKFWFVPNERRVLQCATRVVAVSQFVAQTAKLVLLDVPMKVIYNGVDTDYFRPGKRARQPGGPLRLLYVGSWKRLKGVDLLAPIMRELGDGFELRYTGGSSAENDSKNMPANTHNIGHLDGDEAVIAAMQDSDAVLFPSRSEGFGLVAAEAMACGLPVIATRGSSLVEVVEDGVTGILCPQDDGAAFAAAARALATDTNLAAAMSHASRDLAIRRFAINTMIDSYLVTYEGSLGGLGVEK